MFLIPKIRHKSEISLYLKFYTFWSSNLNNVWI